MILNVKKYQYIKNCDTEKAYAVKYSKYSNTMVFLSKKFTVRKFTEVKDNGEIMQRYFTFEFPDWMFSRMDENQREELLAIQKEWDEWNEKYKPSWED